MQAKIISSLNKCFPDEMMASKKELKKATFLKNERYSFIIPFQHEDPRITKEIVYFKIDEPFLSFANVYLVENIPSMLPVYPETFDDNYLRTEPGLYPDLLKPITSETRLTCNHTMRSLWIELDTDGKLSGNQTFSGAFYNEAGEKIQELSLEIEIIDALLPDQKTTYSQWFYPDCLMQYYNLEMYSEEHWAIIERFMENAHRYGQDMILTPALSPELDTYVGGYRPSTQLTKITLENGKYTFDFSLLKRWIDLAQKIGFKYFEIAHLFSQWGAKFCPQVWATVDGEEKRIFGWDTEALSDEYKNFLSQYIPKLLEFFDALGLGDKCYFHVSDEPHEDNIEQYKQNTEFIRPLIVGRKTIDALSNPAFLGTVDIPVCVIDRLEPFLERKVENLWGYYCCSQWDKVSNRFFAMTSSRTRIIGAQIYKYDLKGFLHWGYNFYNNQFSYNTLNPFICSDGECFAPSGDTYSVYPGEGGKPWPSLRQVLFFDALQDIRAMQLLEELKGKEYVINLIDEGIEPITFKEYPKSEEYLLNLRNRINRAIKESI